MNRSLLTDAWLEKLLRFYIHESLFAPKVVKRSWRERLLSWPWRPWRKTELDWSEWEREPGPCIDRVKIGIIPKIEVKKYE